MIIQDFGSTDVEQFWDKMCKNGGFFYYTKVSTHWCGCSKNSNMRYDFLAVLIIMLLTMNLNLLHSYIFLMARTILVKKLMFLLYFSIFLKMDCK